MSAAGDLPAWCQPGSAVRHETFGTGVVAAVGERGGEQVLWIDFDAGTREAFAPEYAVPLLSPRAFSRRTPPDPAVRCDVCGGRPVVLVVDAQQLCGAHRDDFTADEGTWVAISPQAPPSD